MRVRLTLTEDLLGSNPSSEEVFADYVGSKAPDPAAEILAPAEIVEQLEKAATVFRRDPEGALYMCDYQIKGSLKSRGDAIRARLSAEKANKEQKGQWGGIKGKIDNHVFIFPRVIRLMRDGKPIMKADGWLERPLLAATAQGPRVCLAKSEVIKAGVTLDLEIITRGVVSEKMIEEMLEEGKFYGLGQWRNAGYGRYEWAKQ